MEEFWVYLDAQLQNSFYTTPLLIQTTSALLMGIILISVFISISESNRQTKKHELYKKLVQSVQQKIDRENEEIFLPQQQTEKSGQQGEISVNNSGDQDVKSNLTSSIATLEKEIESMAIENSDLQKDAQETENKWKELEIEIQQAQIKLASVQQETGTLDSEKNNLESNIKSLEAEIKTSEKSVRVKKNEIVQANSKQKKAGKEVNDLKGNIEAEKRRISSLEKQVLDEGKKVEDFERLVGDKEKLIVDKSTQIQKHQHNFEALKNAYNRINVENEDAEEDLSKSDKLSQIIDCGKVKEELMQNKEKLMLMESSKSKNTARLQVAAEKITLLSAKLAKSDGEVGEVEYELQMLKTKARVAKDFYTERDTKAQIEVGRVQQQKEMNKISMEELTTREKEVSTSLQEYKKMNRELRQQLEKVEREKRQKIENFEKQSHINWMAQKDMDREWAAAVQESHDMQSRIEQKSTEMIEVRNASGLGAPEESDSSSDDSEFDGPAPTPPTMPSMMPMFMGMPHMGQPPMAPSPGFNYPTNSYSPFPGQNMPPNSITPNMQQNMHQNVYSNMQPNMHPNMQHSRPPSMPAMPQQYMNPGMNSSMNPGMNPNMGQNMNQNMNPNMNSNMNPNMQQNMHPSMQQNHQQMQQNHPNMQQNHPNMQQNRPPSMPTLPQQYGFQATSTPPPLQQSQINTSQVQQSNE